MDVKTILNTNNLDIVTKYLLSINRDDILDDERMEMLTYCVENNLRNSFNRVDFFLPVNFSKLFINEIDNDVYKLYLYLKITRK